MTDYGKVALALVKIDEKLCDDNVQHGLMSVYEKLEEDRLLFRECMKSQINSKEK